MNFLVTTLGSYGDIYPMVGLALHLKQRGHHVTLFTNPFFQALAHKYDLNFVSIGTEEDYHRFANHPDLFHPRKGVRVLLQSLVLPSLRSAYTQLANHLQGSNTVIVSSILVFASRLLQEKHNIPTVTVHLSPLAIKSAEVMPKTPGVTPPDWFPRPIKRFYWWVADKAVIDPLIGPPLNAFRQELGLPQVEHILSRWGHSPQRVVCLFPDWYAAPQPDWPPRTGLTGFPLFDEGSETELAAEVQAFLHKNEPPIVFMPGSLMQQGRRFFIESIHACQKLGKRAILLSRYPEQIPSQLPDRIRHFPYVPFQQLLPHAVALVHHGGIGTSAQAMRAGVPQLIHPLAYDQYDNAWRLKKLGVGDWILPKDYQAVNLQEKLDALISSDIVKECCQTAAERIRGTYPLVETCRIIEGMI